MSVTRVTVIDVACDYCDNSAEWIGVRTVADGIRQAESQGWLIWKIGRAWKVACAACRAGRGL